MRPITVRFLYTELDGTREDLDYPGVLSSDDAAVFIDDYGICIGPVERIGDGLYVLTGNDVYVREGTAHSIADCEVIAEYLRGISAYDFILRHVVPRGFDIQFEL